MFKDMIYLYIHVLANYATESIILNSLFRDLFCECGIPLENVHFFLKSGIVPSKA